MNCIHFNECITDIANTITCNICNHHLHFTCLNNYGLTTHAWNSTKPSKISIELLNSNLIKFQFKNCKDNTYVNNTDKSNSNSYSESNDCIINKLDKLQIDLNNLNSQFPSYSSSSNNSTILNSISNAISTLPDTLNKSTSKSFSDIVKSTYSYTYCFKNNP